MNFLAQMSKYILYVSLVLNGVLLIYLTGVVPFFLYLSVVVNLVLIWYSISCLLRIDDLENDLISLLKKNEHFLDRLENIHSLEMYYGDEHLQGLIDDSRQLVNDFIDVQEKFFDVEVSDLEYDEEEDSAETPEE